MGLKEVKQEIINEAKKKAEMINKQGLQEVATINRELTSRIETSRKDSENESEKYIAEMNKRETSSAELQGKNIILDIKKKAVDKAFSESLKKLEKESSEARKKRFEKIIARASKEMDIAKIYCNKNHESDLVDSLKSSKINAKISSTDISGGLIVENKEGTVSVDYSYESLLQQVRENLLAEVAAKLFANI